MPSFTKDPMMFSYRIDNNDDNRLVCDFSIAFGMTLTKPEDFDKIIVRIKEEKELYTKLALAVTV